MEQKKKKKKKHKTATVASILCGGVEVEVPDEDVSTRDFHVSSKLLRRSLHTRWKRAAAFAGDSSRTPVALTADLDLLAS